MITYVLSQHPAYWSVARYDTEEVGGPLIRTPSEVEALDAILKEAKKEQPAQILRISLSGESRVVAKFDT